MGRKYPDCPRRTINMEERDFLIEMKIVNETQADLGLTAIPSAYVLDIMCQEFYEKYEEYMLVVNERKERSLRNLTYSSGSGSVKVEEAVKAAAEFNKKFNEERKQQRQAYFDMQTFTCHYPKSNKGKMKVLKKPAPGNYPVAMIPGQFVDHYKNYNSKELQFFPLNTSTAPAPAPALTPAVDLRVTQTLNQKLRSRRKLNTRRRPSLQPTLEQCAPAVAASLLLR